MEQNRLWHEPVVEIYGNAISPGVSCSAKAYDLANRRWYELNVRGTAWSPNGDSSHGEDNRNRTPATNPFQVPDDDWLSSTVGNHVSDYYKSTGSPPVWNIINTTGAGHPVTFEQGRDGRHVGFPISECFFYGHKSSDLLPTIGFRTLNSKTYLSRGADYCDWEGRKCVFKRIEFDCDNESHEQEIRVREQLIQRIAEKSTPKPLDFNNEMMRRFNVVPILGVVLHDDTSQWMVQRRTELSVDEGGDVEGFDSGAEEEEAFPVASMDEVGEAVQKSHTVAGFITPYMGRSLELFGAAHPTECVGSGEAQLPSMPALGSPNTTVDVPITVEQLLDLMRGVRELSRCGITHGDICYWNIVLEEPKPGITPSAVPRLLLIDMGDCGPDYENDAVGLAGVLQWCLKHSPSLREDDSIRKKIIIASALLNEVDFDRAIAVLSPVSVSEHGGKIVALQHADVQRARRRRL